MRLGSFIPQIFMARRPQGSAKRNSMLTLAIAAIGCAAISIQFAFGAADGGDSSPIFGVKTPAGYRQWELVAVSHEGGLEELRGILGNPVAMKAYRDRTLPFLTVPCSQSLPGNTCRRASSRVHTFLARLPRSRSGLEEIRRDGWLGFWPLRQRQTGRPSATRNLRSLPPG
jgi:hypothetical protein